MTFLNYESVSTRDSVRSFHHPFHDEFTRKGLRLTRETENEVSWTEDGLADSCNSKEV